ncbi:hypothetical protein E2C01_014351 [Portunus trituberculatus]|uniref:Uncharacterized protein n=1 Tax=Portunus trituberculatus TaxID=210409 RepID=A0A5B7DJW7_PORTR|nr:hypothetical protein [Portunus trituberculatus]
MDSDLHAKHHFIAKRPDNGGRRRAVAKARGRGIGSAGQQTGATLLDLLAYTMRALGFVMKKTALNVTHVSVTLTI